MHAGPNIDTISDAYTCQGEVVSDGVLGRDLPERGYLEGRAEIGLSAGGHAEGQTDLCMCTSTGTMSFEGDPSHPPGSRHLPSPSITRKRCSLLQALFLSGQGEGCSRQRACEPGVPARRAPTNALVSRVLRTELWFRFGVAEMFCRARW